MLLKKACNLIIIMFITAFHNDYKYLFYCRDVSRHYPHFPTLQGFTQKMLSDTDVSQTFPLLSQFLVAYPRLSAGGAVLSDLILFYQWVHTVLPYTYPMSVEYASTSTFEKIITDREFSALFCRVKGSFLGLGLLIA